MIKSIIVEDDPLYSRNLKKLVNNFKKELKVVSICKNVTEAVIAIKKYKPNLIFLDIELEQGETGFDLLEKIDNIDFDIIFTTAHIDKHIKEIRDFGIGFIVKPYIHNEFSDVLNKYLRKRNNQSGIELINKLKNRLMPVQTDDAFIMIPEQQTYIKISINDILYCMSDDPITNFFLIRKIDGKQKLVSSKSIKDYEKDFEETNIIRIHNRYLVNIKYIKSYIKGDGGYVELITGKSLNVSRTYKNTLLKRLGLTI